MHPYGLLATESNERPGPSRSDAIEYLNLLRTDLIGSHKRRGFSKSDAKGNNEHLGLFNS